MRLEFECLIAGGGVVLRKQCIVRRSAPAKPGLADNAWMGGKYGALIRFSVRDRWRFSSRGAPFDCE